MGGCLLLAQREFLELIEVILAEVIVFEFVGIGQHDGCSGDHPAVVAELHFAVVYSQALQHYFLLPRLHSLEHLPHHFQQTPLQRSTPLHPPLYLSLAGCLREETSQRLTVQRKQIRSILARERNILKDGVQGIARRGKLEVHGQLLTNVFQAVLRVELVAAQEVALHFPDPFELGEDFPAYFPHWLFLGRAPHLNEYMIVMLKMKSEAMSRSVVLAETHAEGIEPLLLGLLRALSLCFEGRVEIGRLKGGRDKTAQLYQQVFDVFELKLVVIAVIAFYLSDGAFGFFQSCVFTVNNRGEDVTVHSGFFDDLIDVGQDVLLEGVDQACTPFHRKGVIVDLLEDGIVVQLEVGLGRLIRVLDDSAEVAVVDVELLVLLLQLVSQKVPVVLNAAHGALQDGLHLVQLEQKVLQLSNPLLPHLASLQLLMLDCSKLVATLQLLFLILDWGELVAIRGQVDGTLLTVYLFLGLQLMSCSLLWVVPTTRICFIGL